MGRPDHYGPTGSTYSTPTAVSVQSEHRCRVLLPKVWAYGDAGRALERHNEDMGRSKDAEPDRLSVQRAERSVLYVVRAACTAVGYYYNGGNTSASLAERWDGKTWALESTPTGVSNPELTRVSCSSASACTAVGFR